MSDHPTEVMSLDELMDLASESGSQMATQPIRTAPRPMTPPAPAPLNPAAAQPTPRATPRMTPRPNPRPPIVVDARKVYDAGLARSRDWLKAGDNTLITATLVVTLLLLLVVAAL